MANEGYLDTRGRPWLGIGVCDRCKRKFPISDLWTDRNNPALKVCIDDLDDLDPWRIPANVEDDIALRYPRPDEALS